MSLERRISEALHAVGEFEPSFDLFSRVHRSIEEDVAHRRRIRGTVIAILAGLALMALFFGRVAVRGEAGELLLPKWSLQVGVSAVLTTILISLGPVLRRFGRPLLDEVFRMSPSTGDHFSRLLDVAYYLFFGGMIVLVVDPTTPASLIPLTDDLVSETFAYIPSFLIRLGIAHVANLVVLPIIGLLFTSAMRRSRRRAAPADAPPLSPRAGQADRVATAIVMTVAVMVVAGTLALVGFILLVLGLG